MADVTFGVKVSEEMKNELSEIMKNTDLTGKEFMNLLLSCYKLESNKKNQEIFSADLQELQKLLSRVQSLYLNIGERSELLVQEKELVIQEKLKEKDQLSEEKEQINQALNQKIKNLEGELTDARKKTKEYQKSFEKLEEEHMNLKNNLQEQKIQFKNTQLLYDKYQEEITNLQNRIEKLKRLEIEIEERNNESTKLKERNDELASQIWFLNREIEKINEEKEENQLKYKEKEMQLQQRYDLELKNSLLEQRLLFNKQIEELKGQQFKLQEDYTQKMKIYLDQKLNMNESLK